MSDAPERGGKVNHKTARKGRYKRHASLEQMRRHAEIAGSLPRSWALQLLDEHAALQRRVEELGEENADKARAEIGAVLVAAGRHTVIEALEAENAELRKAKDGAYSERNKLVAALSKLFPSWLCRTEIEGWDPEWEWCVYMRLPTGQVSWHIHESEREMFAHLIDATGEFAWDGHTTEQKYDRLAALQADGEGEG